jgi:AcrR family transcriptional regulator
MATVSTARGEVTRQRILEATLQVIATEGVRAVTQRRVAKQAGASLGLITYYFDNTTALIASTLEDLGRRETARLVALQGEVETVGADVDGLLDILLGEVDQWSTSRKNDAITNFALTLEIPRGGVSRELFDQWETAQVAFYESVARALGCTEPDDIAMYLLTSVDGISLYAAIAPDPQQVRRGARVGLRMLLQSIEREWAADDAAD